MKRIIKNWEFTDVDRPDITLSDTTKIRINTEDKLDQKLMLKANSDGEFPTDTDLTATLPLTTPNAIKEWQGFEVIGDFPTGTSGRYRLRNGVREIYWDGAAWSTAGPTDWSTEAEIRDNFTTFPFDNKSLGIVVNISTTDVEVTPKINCIKVLGLYDFNVYKDVYITILRALFNNIRPESTMLTSVVTTTSTFDFSSEDYKLQNDGYNIVDMVAIYNVTDDPLKLTNLLSGYTPGAVNQDGQTNAPGVATTTSSIAAGKDVEFVFKYVPEVAIHTDEDYFEIGKVPSIAIESIEEVERRDGLSVEDPNNGIGDFIRDIPNLTAVQVQPPAQIDLRFEYAMFSDLLADQAGLMERMEKFLQDNKILRSVALDEPWSLDTVDRVKNDNKARAGNLQVAKGSFDIRGIPLFVRDALDVPLVEDVNVDITTQE